MSHNIEDRGSQSGLMEPRVDNIEQYSQVGTMDFCWFGFGEPQALEEVDETLPTASHTVEASTSSSSSGESDILPKILRPLNLARNKRWSRYDSR